MESKNKNGVLKLLNKSPDIKDTSKSTEIDSSVLAKLAEDVIAWNRPLTQTEVAEGARPAQVASLESLSRGFKIKRNEENPPPSSDEGVVRLFNKDR